MKLVNLIPLKEIEEPRKKDMEIFNPIAKEYTDALSKFDTLSQRQKDFSKSYFNAKNEDDKLQALSNLKSNQNNLSNAKTLLDRLHDKYERALTKALAGYKH
jgi:hypothetical protein